MAMLRNVSSICEGREVLLSLRRPFRHHPDSTNLWRQ